ncbi:hypothetical protein RGQ15_20100 [Paracoccus sp. MBLB3053]|uniref:Uncharacterized protein n=1 Tax=Paracoccus aurantius TaxID=3073814 RepID=A0ABU2HXU2_9RHOB|nr:hypothetical protein [Paracoccus sp. MBLB3053]MDS9469863.1 hypothetical protein [Paracoccus sp. MBLB3053]
MAQFGLALQRRSAQAARRPGRASDICHRKPERRPHCPVEQAINVALEGIFAEAEPLLLDRFAELTLAELARDFSRHHGEGRDMSAKKHHGTLDPGS